MSFHPVTINGRTYDFTSIRPSGLPKDFDTRFFTAFLRGVSFNEQITPSVPAGVHGIPLPRGRGIYTCTTSMDVIWEAWDEATKNMAESGLDGYTDLNFDLKIQYKTQGRVSEIVWHESSFLGPSANHTRGGADGLTVTIPMYTRYITTNGVCAYPLDLDQDLSSVNNGGVTFGL